MLLVARKLRYCLGPTILGLLLLFASTGRATPPDYKTFARTQRTEVKIDPDKLMRIWVVYVGQGDGIVIQLPRQFDRVNESDAEKRGERVDVLIDGGSATAADAKRMKAFLNRLYPGDTVSVEHAVLTHHDQDHVSGLTYILESEDVSIEHIYHNGLASYVPGARGLPASGQPNKPCICSNKQGSIAKALGLLGNDNNVLNGFVMDDLNELRKSSKGHELSDVYADFASAIVNKKSPQPVQGFHRVTAASPFIGEIEAETTSRKWADLRFEPLWPAERPRKFGDWGESINGNSVTFRLVYGDFEMLFTGDQNERSEKEFLDALTSEGALSNIKADVLKVPHHGSKHGIESFFKAVEPVVSIASQGKKGAQSKKLSGSQAWEHPSPEVIRWLGGAHRVYLTQLHERAFDWDDIDTQKKLDGLMEYTHVLVETDGKWFRVVEIPIEETNLDNPPAVAETERGNGTRWIEAR